MTSNLKLASSSELISNYKQIELLDQSRKFLAVHTKQGHTLFFGIGTDDHFHLIQEKPKSTTGWEKVELSTDLIGTVKTFDVAQNHEDGHIDIAVVLTDSAGEDTLYLSMDNSDTDLSWTKQIVWNQILDDRRQPQNPKLEITSLYLAETRTGTEYVIADTKDNQNFIARYWINATGVQKWNPHPLAVDLAAGGVLDSYMGRKSGDLTDGVYTLGQVNHLLQLIYTPLYNPFAPNIAPNPTNFDLDGTKLTSNNVAFSGCKAASGAANATDVFIAGGGTLHYLSSENQTQLAKPVPILNNTLFGTMRSLYASTSATKVVVWGLNDADQIFYTTCKPSDILNPEAWSTPLPIMTGVSEASPYVDRVNDGITIFANTNIGAGQILKGIQDPISTLWKFDKIELPTPEHTAKATKALSYTSTVHVTDQNNNPAAGVEVIITPKSRTTVYINNLYYTLYTHPVSVKTDANGVITLIEWVDNLQGTQFSFHTDNATNAHLVDPMQAPLDTMVQMDTEQKLNSAQITNSDGTTRPLLPATIPIADKKILVSSLKNLHTAHHALRSKPNGNQTVGVGATKNKKIISKADNSVIHYVEVAAGDVLRFIKHAGESAVELIKSAAEETWHFIVKIGKEVYGFILNTVDKIAGALEAIWQRIVKGFEDLLDFLKFLFDWQDMVRTKDVMKQCVKIFFHRMGEDLQKTRHSLDQDIDTAEQAIRDWASIPDAARPSLGSLDHSLNATLAKSNDTSWGHSAPAKMLQSHFASNIHRSTTSISPPTVATDPSWSGLTDLSGFVTREKATMDDLSNQVKQLLVSLSGPANPDWSEILKRIAGDIAIGAMDLFKLASDKILDLLTLLMDEIMEGLDTPIHIPIVSDILEDLFGIKLPSILDVICLIGAVPATIVYKALHGKAPYPGGTDSLDEKIKKAKTYEELETLFGSSGDQITLSNEAQGVIFETGHIVSGIATMLRGIFVVLDEETDGAAKSVLQTPKTITSVVASITHVMGDLFVMPAALKDKTIKTYGSVVSKINILQIVAFMVAPKAISKIKGVSGKSELKALGKEIGIVADGIGALLALIGLVAPCYHFSEIATNKTDSESNKALSGMESTQDITGKLSKTIGFAALVDGEEISKQVLIIVQGVLIGITSQLQLAEAGVKAA